MKKRVELGNVSEIIKSLFVYAVLLITLVISIFGGIQIFNSAADYLIPNNYIESYEDYKNYNYKDRYGESHGVEYSTLSEDEIRANYEAYKADSIEKSKQSALKELIKSIGTLIIALPIFYVFQKKVDFNLRPTRREEIEVVENNLEENK